MKKRVKQLQLNEYLLSRLNYLIILIIHKKIQALFNVDNFIKVQVFLDCCALGIPHGVGCINFLRLYNLHCYRHIHIAAVDLICRKVFTN